MGWGPVDWVGRVLPEAKFENKTILFFEEKNYLSDRYRDICKKRCLGTSWMGWGPVDWVGMVLPEAKLENKTTLFFEIFWFERPIARYLLKTILHCKGSRIWGNAITEVVHICVGICICIQVFMTPHGEAAPATAKCCIYILICDCSRPGLV